ncbi:hypothetical protein CERSUDRAFT_120409 [Gelatoporia subvermispora B]|uniref:Uncharacterized protein n=1 Tax=Ceriporiopsis subvermispora (strain B) TaxID=914234 RepID=M2QVR0_CERS8|nr:hypothetical protein CERSUDRAFT_120409 [Gelatoporia subvermispora B]
MPCSQVPATPTEPMRDRAFEVNGLCHSLFEALLLPFARDSEPVRRRSSPPERLIFLKLSKEYSDPTRLATSRVFYYSTSGRLRASYSHIGLGCLLAGTVLNQCIQSARRSHTSDMCTARDPQTRFYILMGSREGFVNPRGIHEGILSGSKDDYTGVMYCISVTVPQNLAVPPPLEPDTCVFPMDPWGSVEPCTLYACRDSSSLDTLRIRPQARKSS